MRMSDWSSDVCSSDLLSGLASPSKIVAAAPGASEIRLQRFAEAPVWRAETPDGPRLFDARTGAPLPALTESQVREQARRIYTGDGQIVSVRLLTKDRKSTRLNSSH